MNSNNGSPNILGSQRIVDVDKDFEEPFGKVPQAFFRYGLNLTDGAKVIYAILRTFRNENKNQIAAYGMYRCHPEINRLMIISGYGRNKVINALQELKTFGWIRRYNLPRSLIQAGYDNKPNAQNDMTYPVNITDDGRTVHALSPTKAQAREWKKNLKAKYNKTRTIPRDKSSLAILKASNTVENVDNDEQF